MKNVSERVDNEKAAQILEEIADMLEIQGESVFKVNAYRRAAENIRSLGRDLSSMVQDGSIFAVEGIGKAIGEKITELVTKGRLEYYEKLSQEVPRSLLEILEIPDMGPKRVKAVWEKLKVTTIEELEEAAKSGRLAELPGFGPKSVARILAGIEERKRALETHRIPLVSAWILAEMVKEGLLGLPGLRIEVGGSFRRKKETVGDLDFLVSSHDPEAAVERFCSLPMVQKVLLRGSKKASVLFKGSIQGDLRVIERSRWGTALQYFTGSKEHNVQMRELALKKGFSLSEYSFKAVDGGDEILCAEEEEVYAFLGLPWILPELREGRRAVDEALKGNLPNVVNEEDLKGDPHVHTLWSDGFSSIEEMVLSAKEKGLRWIAITDHSAALAVAGGLDTARLRSQMVEIDDVNRKQTSVRVLKGVEAEILADGTVDVPGDLVDELDIVIGSLHLSMRQSREEITRRYLKAIRHPRVHIIAHPTGRLLGQRQGMDADWEVIFEEASRTGTILEINANPYRLDLPDYLAALANEKGCLFSIGSDAHRTSQMELLHFGVSVARRAWINKDRIVNTWELDKLLDWAKSKHDRL